MNENKGFRVLVFIAAFCCLMFELIISRVADFYLDSRNGFVAIPITFLGLAFGSLHVQFRKRIVERFNVQKNLIMLVTVSFLTLTAVFLIFSQYLTVTGAYSIMATLRHSINKSVFFVAVFIIPFYCFGRVLTVCYHLNRQRIGAIYSADFFGASLACFLTPVLFHMFNLPGVLFAFTCGLTLLVLLFLRLPWKRTLILCVVLVAVNAAFLRFVLYADNHTNFTDFFKGEGGGSATEIAHAWNEFSRVSVIRIEDKGGRQYFKIIHDNAQSNVNVVPYHPEAFRAPSRVSTVESLFLLGRPISNVMVMFAGCGAQMIPFHEFSGGKARITGIELNPLVKELAVTTPALKDFHLRDFYALPNVDLRITEGRSFLVGSPDRFDVIFVGSKAPTNVQLTGHSRKYLDTTEAFGLYLDHLTDDGLLLFNYQPLPDVIVTLKRIFQERNLPNFEQCAIVLQNNGKYDLVISKRPFSQDEMQRLTQADSQSRSQIDYAPFLKENGGQYAGQIKAPLDPHAKPITDDRPFIWNLDFAQYRLIPDSNRIKDDYYFFNWTRLTTLLALTAFTACFIVVACLRKASRPPVAAVVYLLITGFCYLLVEVTFMAKLELFLQDLLVSMATTLTVFLMASGLGSLLSRRLSSRIGMRLLPFVVALVVFASIYLLDLSTHHLLALPIVLRIGVVTILVLPVGVCLGMFYPCAIAGLVKNGFEHAVPITYGISTLSSVVGATYAMTLMTQVGFNNLLLQASAAYALLGVLIVLYSLFAKRSVFDLT